MRRKPQLKTLVRKGLLSLTFALSASTLSFPQTALADPTFQANAADVCVPVTQSLSSSQNTELTRYILKTLAESSHGKMLTQYAETQGVSLCVISPEEGRSGYFNTSRNALILSNEGDPLKLVKTAAHELRHKWQIDNGFSASTEYTPEHMSLIGKVMEADAEAYSNLVAFELEKKGYDVRNSFPELYDYVPVYEAFQSSVRAEGSETPDNREAKALRAAFNAWFKLPIAATHYEYSYLSGFEGFIEDPRVLNHYPISYGNKNLTDEELLKIGDMPDGSNYLKATGGISIADGKYSGSLNAENAGILARVKEKISQKQKDFCETRPESEQKFCLPYPTKKNAPGS